MGNTTETRSASAPRRSGTEAFKPKFETLVQLYEHAVGAYGERPLFGIKRGGEWLWINYRDFATQVDEVRGGLADLGVGAGDRVMMIANNRPEWAVAAYATYARGAVFVPTYESTPVKEWEFILTDCAAKVCFVANERIRDAVVGLQAKVPTLEHVVVIDGAASGSAITLDDLRARGRANQVANVHPAPSDLAGLIYTSGTTGNPKGVELSHANLANNVSAMHAVFPMTTEDRSLSFLPWAHSFGQTVELHALFSMGASMGIAESVDKIVDNLSEVKPTLLFSVPRIFNRIYDRLQKQMAESPPLRRAIFQNAVANSAYRKQLAEQRRTSGFADFKQRIFDKIVFQKVRDRFGGRLKYAFSGGAAINKDVAEFIDNLGITVYEGYGLTETSPIATANWPGARKIGSVGKAIPGVRVAIDLTDSGDPRNGEVVVYGHNVMQGYYNQPEENAKVFTEDRGFRTGDLGYLDDDGFLYITGRIKEQYKLENGKYVAPSHLEDQLKVKSSFVANAFIYGDNKPYNVALIVPKVDELEAWAAASGVSAKGEALLTDERVVAMMTAEVEKAAADFKAFERIKKIKLIGEDFTLENGMLTPKMSLKRREVMKRWGSDLERMY